MKKIFSCWILVLFCIGCGPRLSVAEKGKIQDQDTWVYVKGKLLEEGDLRIWEDRSYLPLACLEKNLGEDFSAERHGEEITLKDQARNVQMRVGQTWVEINGKKKEISAAPRKEGEVIFIPIRAFAETFEMEIHWDQENRVILLSRYGGQKSTEGDQVQFHLKNRRWTIRMSPGLQERILCEEGKDNVTFYDQYNRTRAEDGSSGALLYLVQGKSPSTIIAPGILLDHHEGTYTEAVFESGVEYSQASKEFFEQYKKSRDLLVEALKTFEWKEDGQSS